MPGSSSNSWDSWFIFNLRKNKHLLLHDIFVHGKGQRGYLLLLVSLHVCQLRNHCDLGCWFFPAILAVRLATSWNSSLQCAHDLSNVHTWAMFIVLMTAAHISPNVFFLRTFLSNTQRLFLTVHNNIIHTHYTSHSYAHLHLLFYMSYLYLHFFWSSWQAGCSWPLVSDTSRQLK
jgi:hypothetical protein